MFGELGAALEDGTKTGRPGRRRPLGGAYVAVLGLELHQLTGAEHGGSATGGCRRPIAATRTARPPARQ